MTLLLGWSGIFKGFWWQWVLPEHSKCFLAICISFENFCSVPQPVFQLGYLFSHLQLFCFIFIFLYILDINFLQINSWQRFSSILWASSLEWQVLLMDILYSFRASHFLSYPLPVHMFRKIFKYFLCKIRGVRSSVEVIDLSRVDYYAGWEIRIQFHFSACEI